MSVYRIVPKPGEEPHKWKVETFANIDGNEIFIRHINELCEILGATSIRDQQREDAKYAILSVLFDGLMPAFAELQKIKTLEEKSLPLMDVRELYHGFYGKLWTAYKDLTQRAAAAIGFKIGFLFQDDKDFAKALPQLLTDHPGLRPELGKALEHARTSWQNEIGLFRNTVVVHPDADATNYAKFYETAFAEWMFTEVWNMIVDLLALLLETRLFHGQRLFLPDLEKYPKWPNRFMLGFLGKKASSSSSDEYGERGT